MSPLPPADSYRILLVEDSAAEVRLIQEAVKEAALSGLVEFEFAYDGEEACDVLDASKESGKKYDLILLDLNLPKITGLEVLKKIKTETALESIPVIVVTNSDYKKDMIESYRLKADGYLQKPADFKKLVDFFVSVRKSIEVRHKLSIYYIEKVYDELQLAV